MAEIKARNEISGGRFAQPVVQATSVAGGINVHSPVRVVWSAMGNSRGFGVAGFLYRCVASLAGCAALGALAGGTPLAVLGRWFDWLGLPTGWIAATGQWITAREQGLGQAAVLLLLVGLLSLPGPEKLRRDLGESLWWRSPSTVVLAGAVLVQCGAGLWSLVMVLAVVGVAVWMVGRIRGGADAGRELAVVGVMALVLAVGFLPLWLLAAVADRDGRRND